MEADRHARMTLGDVLDRIKQKDEKRRQRAYDVLCEFGLIDGEGFYTIYETKR